MKRSPTSQQLVSQELQELLKKNLGKDNLGDVDLINIK